MKGHAHLVLTGDFKFGHFTYSYLSYFSLIFIDIRTCAEWLLKNGACVKFVGSSKFLCDYNILPPENSKFKVKEISADNAGSIHRIHKMMSFFKQHIFNCQFRNKRRRI